jgi:hypothetical protein
MRQEQNECKECYECTMIYCQQYEKGLNIKNIFGIDGTSVRINYPEPIEQCEVFKWYQDEQHQKGLPEEQFLLVLGWFHLRETLLEEPLRDSED